MVNRIGVGAQHAAGLGELDAPRGAHEQRRPDLVLELADLGADRLLGQVQPLGRA